MAILLTGHLDPLASAVAGNQRTDPNSYKIGGHVRYRCSDSPDTA